MERVVPLYVYYHVPMRFYLNIFKLFSSARGLFLALSAAAHSGDLLVHHRASLDPGRAPWHVLWTFEVARAWTFSRGRFSPSQSHAGPWKPQTIRNVCMFSPLVLLFRKYHSSPQRLCSHGASAALEAFSFLTATNGCLCVCV